MLSTSALEEDWHKVVLNSSLGFHILTFLLEGLSRKRFQL